MSFSPNTVAPGSNATMTISSTANTPTTSFSINVTGTAGQLVHSQTVMLNVVANVPPTIATINDQTVKSGEVRTVPISASDQNGNTGLKLSLVSAPSFVTLSDNGNGMGTIRIAPSLMDMQSGRVTVQVTDPGGLFAQTSFSVTVLPGVMITGASFTKPNLIINGIGFGSSGAKVNVNGRDISSLVVSQTDTTITLKGNKKKLSLKKGSNQITVTAGGVTSNTFVLNLLAD